ncbi:MAG: DUF222 domain-containing protein [Sporichthyaceae bacterium]
MYRIHGGIFASDAAFDDGLDVQRALISEALDCERDKARAEGRLYTALAALNRDCARRAGEDDGLYERLLRSAYEELALASASSPDHTAGTLHQAAELQSRLPRTFAALRAGDIGLYKAQAMLNAAITLTVEQCLQYEEGLLPTAADLPPAKLRRIAAKLVRRIDKSTAKKREKKAREDRRVWLTPGEDGTYWFGAQLPAEQAVAIFGVIDTLAKATKPALEPGDNRTIDALRADTFVDLILNPNGESRVKYEMRVLAPAGTLLGLNDQDGHLPGHGPIPAEICRELAADSTWRRILTDPDTSHVLDVGAHVREPSARMREYIEARDQRCRWPGCHRQAHKADLDHTVMVTMGGLTIRINLSALCERHHIVRHLPGWKVTQDPDGSGALTWTTPTGRIYRTRPPTPLGDEAELTSIKLPEYDECPF